MVKIIKDVHVKCPVCNMGLVVYWDEYYTDFDGDVIKDSDIAWECPNGCLFDNDQMNNVDEEIKNKIWDDT